MIIMTKQTLQKTSSSGLQTSVIPLKLTLLTTDHPDSYSYMIQIRHYVRCCKTEKASAETK